MDLYLIKKYKDKIIIILVTLLLCIGILVRVLGIDKIPNALNVDEASAGYEGHEAFDRGCFAGT